MNKSSILVWAGFVITIFGGFLCFCWDPIFNRIIAKEIRLTPTSKTFQEWKEPSMPLNLDFYFFNWTNPEELYDEGFKPKLVEMGPYRFNEYFGKVNITWNKNHTVSYLRRRFWYFDPENSVGTLDDNVTTLNPIALSAAYVTRYRSYFVQYSLSSAMMMSGQRVWVTKTAGEFLYEGYSDTLLTMANKMPSLSSHRLPGERFAWFYNRNGSSTYEGTFNMETGEEDISKVGILREWNYQNQTDFYRAECGMINGSDGALYPPGRTRDKPIQMYSAEFCKSIKFDYLEDAEVLGIPGYRYVGSRSLLDSGEIDPDNWCNCNGECVPSGVFNISACRYGAPAFVSYPHFLYADPYYLQQVDGLEPNETRHRFHITLEPKTGLPLAVAARFQINLLLQPSEYITLFSNVPKIFFPMIWFEETVTVSPELANSLKELLSLPMNGIIFSVIMMLVGIIVVVSVLVPKYFFTKSGEMEIHPEKIQALEIVRLEKQKATAPPEEHALLSDVHSDKQKSTMLPDVQIHLPNK